MKDRKKKEIELKDELYVLSVILEESKTKDMNYRREIATTTNEMVKKILRKKQYFNTKKINECKRRMAEIREELVLLKVIGGKDKKSKKYVFKEEF